MDLIQTKEDLAYLAGYLQASKDLVKLAEADIPIFKIVEDVVGNAEALYLKVTGRKMPS